MDDKKSMPKQNSEQGGGTQEGGDRLIEKGKGVAGGQPFPGLIGTEKETVPNFKDK